MEFRPLEMKLISAKGLKDVNVFTTMDVYAVVSINGDHRTSQKTPLDKGCGPNPQWNYTLKFTVDEAAARHNHLNLVIRLKSRRQLGDRDIGEVHVPIMELLDDKEKLGGGEPQHVSYSVRTPSGKAKGTLSFSYKFGDKFEKAAAMAYPPPPVAGAMHVDKHGESQQPVMAYPPAGPSSSGYPPHGMAAGAYPYPPPGYQYQPYGYPHGAHAAVPSYGYPGQHGGYGLPPQRPKKGGMGAGLGLGLAGGLLGGMLLGDMVGDAYDAGFDDGADFDF